MYTKLTRKFNLATTIIVVAGSVLTSCEPRQVPVAALNRYIENEDNGLCHVQEWQHIRLSLTYHPTDLLVYRSLSSRPASGPTVDSLRRKFAGYHYFLLSLSHDNKELLQPGALGDAYSDLLQTLAFRMGQYVRLSTPRDTLSLADCRLDPTLGMAMSTQVMFAFEKEKMPTPSLQFTLDEFGLGIGPQHFKVLTEDLEKIRAVRSDDLSMDQSLLTQH
jgi:hypothetical protein